MKLLVAVMAIVVALAASPVGAQEESQEPTVRRATEGMLEMDTGRQAAVRVPRVTLDAASGDLTVVFAMRRPLADDPHQIVAHPPHDAFTILSAAYTHAPPP